MLILYTLHRFACWPFLHASSEWHLSPTVAAEANRIQSAKYATPKTKHPIGDNHPGNRAAEKAKIRCQVERAVALSFKAGVGITPTYAKWDTLAEGYGPRRAPLLGEFVPSSVRARQRTVADIATSFAGGALQLSRGKKKKRKSNQAELQLHSKLTHLQMSDVTEKSNAIDQSIEAP